MQFWLVEGSVWGQAHWHKISYQLRASDGKIKILKGILDKSTGMIYRSEDRVVMRAKALWSALYMPVHLLFVTLYHLGRIAAVTIYLSVRASTREQIKEEVQRSVDNITRAPLFASALFCGALFAVVDPFNGRKIIATYEYEWNHCISLDESVLLCVPVKKNWKFHCVEKENGHYVLGCFQPVARLIDNAIYRPYSEEVWNDCQVTKEPSRAALFCCFV